MVLLDHDKFFDQLAHSFQLANWDGGPQTIKITFKKCKLKLMGKGSPSLKTRGEKRAADSSGTPVLGFFCLVRAQVGSSKTSTEVREADCAVFKERLENMFYYYTEKNFNDK
ncbi:hypothetical protein MHBO_000385 [Bonamia ostreae]|uniref:Signal recognition particle 14 kDa protein n=1 Tax=Bonamia ostreae TaxID=126728 RepID=A0ABV2AFH9_9EUKA